MQANSCGLASLRRFRIGSDDGDSTSYQGDDFYDIDDADVASAKKNKVFIWEDWGNISNWEQEAGRPD